MQTIYSSLFRVPRRLILLALPLALAGLAFWWMPSTPPVNAQGPTCVTPPSNMVGWWPGDGNTNDIQGGNHGTLQNGAMFTTGIVGQGFLFDGVDDYVSVPDPGGAQDLDGYTQLTLDAWIRPNEVSYELIVAKYDSRFTNGASYYFGIEQGILRFLVIQSCCGSVISSSVIESSSPLVAGNVYHVAGVWRGGNQLELYVNGAQIAATITTTGAAPTVLANNNTPVNIGRAESGSGSVVAPIGPFNGLIDEVEIFNRALSASEVQGIFNAGSAGKCKPGANQAPVASCQNVTMAAGPGCTANASIDAGSSDPDGDPLTLTQTPAGPYPIGTTSVTLTVDDGKGGSSTCSATVTVVDNTPPAITPPPNITQTTDPGLCSAVVSLGTPTVSDNCGTASVTNNAPAGNVFPLGTTTVTWTVMDVNGNSNTAQQTVVVNDNVAPTISGGSASPAVLWPPNHKMVNVTINYSASDLCGATTCVISSVTSNEPINGTGDGDTAPDWEIVDAQHVRLRAERAGNGNGRVYTITIVCTDASGNSSNKIVTVTVPKSQGK